ncbi:MAG: hypothetical protein FWG87_02010 [Defluviitaleaceae bacterium]|nr:hypothetical protein [Defluviitaleaceae bacterium]
MPIPQLRAYLGTDKSVPYKELTRFYRSCVCRSCVCRGGFVGDEFTRPEVCTYQIDGTLPVPQLRAYLVTTFPPQYSGEKGLCPPLIYAYKRRILI